MIVKPWKRPGDHTNGDDVICVSRTLWHPGEESVGAERNWGEDVVLEVLAVSLCGAGGCHPSAESLTTKWKGP